MGEEKNTTDILLLFIYYQQILKVYLYTNSRLIFSCTVYNAYQHYEIILLSYESSAYITCFIYY